MIDEKRKKEAKQNFDRYLREGLIKKEKNEISKDRYIKNALEVASVKAEEIVDSYSFELDKRSRFQYNMLEETKESKAQTSLRRAKEFSIEMNKLFPAKKESEKLK